MKADTAALVALIQQVPILTSATFTTQTPYLADGQPTYPTPYALLHPADGLDEQSRVTGPPTTQNYEATIHLVGVTAEQVQTIAGLLKLSLMPDGFGIIPTVTGRKCQRLYWRSPLPIQTNTDVTPPLVYQVVEIGWRSDPS